MSLVLTPFNGTNIQSSSSLQCDDNLDSVVMREKENLDDYEDNSFKEVFVKYSGALAPFVAILPLN